MTQMTSQRRVPAGILYLAPSLLLLGFLAFCSFAAGRFADDFLKQLGITKAGADEKISNSLLGGYFSAYGIKNAKNIALGNRKAVTLDLLTYTKQFAGSAAFAKQYNELKNRNKPKEQTIQTPEQMRAETIATIKKSLVEMEGYVKNADTKMKPTFESALADARKMLKDAEDPANRAFVNYSKNYNQLLKDVKNSNEQAMAAWEAQYPASPLLYIKKNLVEFMNVTKDIDYNAELTARNGKKYFTNPGYERKDSRWKMAFRAGKEVVEPAREFVQKWIEEIK